MTEPFSTADKAFMRRALELAHEGEKLGEVPVGAVVVANGMVVGEGFNAPISRHEPTAHAEVMALRDAASRLANYRLDEATLYVTLEPCTMCVGALVHARVARVVFAATEPKAGSLTSARRQLESGYYNHVFVWQGGLLADEAGEMLSAFFRRRRAEQKVAASMLPDGAEEEGSHVTPDATGGPLEGASPTTESE
ncbi:MAG TPA: tRNA adenosine(34) deaminase TadA [Moraxellaceae bacterium]|nr:tRNA adenosine(34) deaminase TadA [Moraxellaceae bacterium]